MTTFSDAQLLNLTPEQLPQLTPEQLARRQDLINKQQVNRRESSQRTILPAKESINPIAGE
jgi:hypothetical protein